MSDSTPHPEQQPAPGPQKQPVPLNVAGTITPVGTTAPRPTTTRLALTATLTPHGATAPALVYPPPLGVAEYLAAQEMQQMTKAHR